MSLVSEAIGAGVKSGIRMWTASQVKKGIESLIDKAKEADLFNKTKDSLKKLSK